MCARRIEQEDITFQESEFFPQPKLVNSYLDNAKGSASPDPTSIYLAEIRKIPLLTRADEIKFGQKIRKGQEEKELAFALCAYTSQECLEIIAEGDLAIKKMTEHNLRLVANIAKRYKGRGVSMLDMIQDGNIGLGISVEKFDERMGYKFSTYATWWIRQAILRGIAENGRTIRIPEHMLDVIKASLKVSEELVQELGRPPKIHEIAEKMGIPELKLRKIFQYNQLPVSLDNPINDEESDKGTNQEDFGDFIIDKSVNIPETVVRDEESETVRNVLYAENSSLSDRERRVLEMRFGLDDGRSKTLDEVGKIIGVTRERIRQNERDALRKFEQDFARFNPKEYAERLKYPTNPNFKRPAAFAKEDS